MNRFALFFFASVICLTRAASATETVAFPAGDASWTVTFTVLSSAAATPAPKTIQKKAQQVEVTQVNKVRRVIITWSDTTTTQQWAIPPLPVNFEEDPRTGAIDPNTVGSFSEGATRFAVPYDNSAFGWVTPNTLQEKTAISYEGHQCFHYLGQASAYPGGPVQTREAWIDSTTLLPVALQTSDSLAAFSFSEKPPVGPLNIPPKFKKEIHYYEVIMGYHRNT